MSKKKIFIDPGHGGTDPGAIGLISNEATNVLKVALALEKKLIAAGYEVKLSRRTDTYVSLSQRAKMAGDWGADIFISLHNNSAVNKAATGFETFIFNGSVSARSISLQTHLHASIIGAIGLSDRGKKRANFAVLRETAMPAALIEYGFISNVKDEKIIALEIEKQAQLTFEGINKFYGVTVAKPAVTAPVNKEDDDTMRFTNSATKNAVRAYIEDAVEKKAIDKLWLDKFDKGTITNGDFDGLKLIVPNRLANKK